MMVWRRVRADFLMRPRLGEYRRLLESALEASYRVVGIEQFWRREPGQPGSPGPGGQPVGRLLVLRHDVDTDPVTAGEMWRIERELGAAGSYFFRLSTIDWGLMSAIAAGGGEVGYHYEELATVAKRRRPRGRTAALGLLPEAREEFRGNLERLRSRSGLPLRVAASHGDFVNRRLGVANWAILADRAFRTAVGVDLEAYDDDLLARMPLRSADTSPPRCWIPIDPAPALARGEPVVYILVHPRHWRVARLANARDDLGRFVEEVAFRRPWPGSGRRGA